MTTQLMLNSIFDNNKAKDKIGHKDLALFSCIGVARKHWWGGTYIGVALILPHSSVDKDRIMVY